MNFVWISFKTLSDPKSGQFSRCSFRNPTRCELQNPYQLRIVLGQNQKSSITKTNRFFSLTPVSTSSLRSLNNRNTTRPVNSALPRGLSPSSSLSLTSVANRTRPHAAVSGVQPPPPQSGQVNSNATAATNLIEAGNAEALHAYSAQQ